MRRVRESVAKWMSALVAVNMVVWLVSGNAAMAKCNDYKCEGGWHTFWDYYLETGKKTNKIHGTRYVYVSKKFKVVSSRQQIMTGCLAWNMKGNSKIHIETTSDYDKCHIYIVPEILEHGVDGITYLKPKGLPYVKDLEENLHGNYCHAKIEMSESRCHMYKYFTKVATHETGHALGLSHVTCRNSVMCPGMDSKKMLAAPSALDKSTLCHIYNAIYK